MGFVKDEIMVISSDEKKSLVKAVKQGLGRGWLVKFVTTTAFLEKINGKSIRLCHHYIYYRKRSDFESARLYQIHDFPKTLEFYEREHHD